MDWSENGFLALSALNVKPGYIDPNTDAHYGNQELYDRWMSGKELCEGQVLFTTEAPMGNVAQVPDNKGYILSQRTIAFDVKNTEITDDFLAVMLGSPKVFNELSSLSSGGTAKGVSQKSLSQLNVQVPRDISEQVQIGCFFKQLDSTITLHQRKVKLLKQLKQGYLQQMFPQNDEKAPQLRFANFSEEWEQRKLGDVVEFLNGRAYKQPELLDSGKYPVLRVGNFGTNNKWYYSDLVLDDKFYAENGDLLYTWATAFGPHVWNGEKVIYHYHIWKIELSEYLARDYTLQLLEADKVRLLANTNGSTMIHVTKGEMESKVVSVPLIEEQYRIGIFFKKIEETITLHQKKLDNLKQIKTAYLKLMFI